jgi:hypothetical protein
MPKTIDDLVLGQAYCLKTYQTLEREFRKENGDFITPHGNISGRYLYVFYLPNRNVRLQFVDTALGTISVKLEKPDLNYIDTTYNLNLPVEVLDGF